MIEASTGTIGLLAFIDNAPVWDAMAQQPAKPGVLYVPVDLRDRRATQLLERVRQSRATVDFLLVLAHWRPHWGVGLSLRLRMCDLAAR